MRAQLVQDLKDRKARGNFLGTCLVIVWEAFCYAWWQRVFLILVFGKGKVDRQGLTIVLHASRGEPTYLSNGEPLTWVQSFFYTVGWMLLAVGVPYLVLYIHKKWAAKSRPTAHSNSSKHPASRRRIGRRSGGG